MIDQKDIELARRYAKEFKQTGVISDDSARHAHKLFTSLIHECYFKEDVKPTPSTYPTSSAW